MSWLAPALGFLGTLSANQSSARQAERQMAFQERLSGSAHQRQVTDMRQAGLNPILSATGGKGASTPGGAMGKVLDPTTSALNSKRLSYELKNMHEQNRLLQSQSRLASMQQQVALNTYKSSLGDAKKGAIQNSYLQSPAGRKAYLAQLISNSAKSILNPLKIIQ